MSALMSRQGADIQLKRTKKRQRETRQVKDDAGDVRGMQATAPLTLRESFEPSKQNQYFSFASL